LDIETIRQQVQAGQYLIKAHAVLHALKEGFDRAHMVEAILAGRIIESHPEAQRVLICGPTTLAKKTTIHLHVVCEVADPNYVEFVTAYIPDEFLWENPPYRRRKRRES